MPRLPDDPSGPGRVVTVRLAPRRLALLDEEARRRGWSRARLVSRLIDRALMPPPTTEAENTRTVVSYLKKEK
jgi:hypothetical protein